MKAHIFALFTDIEVADRAINHLHNELKVAAEEISYVYRNKDGDKVSGEGSEVAADTPTEGAKKGAAYGGAIGAAIGVAAAFGVAGPLGAVVAAGWFSSALGIGGILGATTAGAATGAAAGGLVGALTNMGVSEPKARTFEDRVEAGAVLVSIHTDKPQEVADALQEHNAEEIEVIEENV